MKEKQELDPKTDDETEVFQEAVRTTGIEQYADKIAKLNASMDAREAKAEKKG